MKLTLLGMVLGVLLTTNAFAGLLIDPYIGVGQTKVAYEIDGYPSLDSDDAYSSNAYGARLGFSTLMFALGVDYQILNYTDDDDDKSTVTSTSAFVGVGLPMIRFWGEYMFNSEIEADDSDNIDVDFKGGYGLGIGYTGLPLVSLNLEFETLNYEYTASGYDVDLSIASTVFSISFPINI